MARYIDADELIKKIFPYEVVDKKLYYINAQAVYDAISKAPTADVAPRAELEKDLREVKCLCGEIKSDLPLVVSEARLNAAREIFEEIDYVTKEHASGDIDDHWLYIRLAELEKKYTEKT